MMCLLATKAPASQLAALALEELDLVVTMFQAASGTCRSAANLLVSDDPSTLMPLSPPS